MAPAGYDKVPIDQSNQGTSNTICTVGTVVGIAIFHNISGVRLKISNSEPKNTPFSPDFIKDNLCFQPMLIRNLDVVDVH